MLALWELGEGKQILRNTRPGESTAGPAAQRPADLLSSAFFTSANGAGNLSSLIPPFLRISLMETVEKQTPTESTYILLYSLTCFPAGLLRSDRFRPRSPLPAPIATRLPASLSLRPRPSYTPYYIIFLNHSSHQVAPQFHFPPGISVAR